MVSLINAINGSNLEDIEFMFKWAMIGRSRFFSFNPVNTDNGSSPSEVDTFPTDDDKFVSLKLNSFDKGINGSAKGFKSVMGGLK